MQTCNNWHPHLPPQQLWWSELNRNLLERQAISPQARSIWNFEPLLHRRQCWHHFLLVLSCSLCGPRTEFRTQHNEKFTELNWNPLLVSLLIGEFINERIHSLMFSWVSDLSATTFGAKMRPGTRLALGDMARLLDIPQALVGAPQIRCFLGLFQSHPRHATGRKQAFWQLGVC